jgi:ABC-type transport system involved in cytochrome bd biosynthesis fused ATPase/permease subunit
MKVTIAVVGENGCGKSTAISKGLKAYRLADPMMTTDSPEDDALFQCAYADLFYQIMCVIVRSILDTLRVGKVSDEQGGEAVLNVLEVDSAVLKARRESNYDIWPERAPPLDGVMVCCDVSRKESFTEVEDVLRS